MAQVGTRVHQCSALHESNVRRNQDSVVRRVRVVPPDTNLFKVKRNRKKSANTMDKVHNQYLLKAAFILSVS